MRQSALLACLMALLVVAPCMGKPHVDPALFDFSKSSSPKRSFPVDPSLFDFSEPAAPPVYEVNRFIHASRIRGSKPTQYATVEGLQLQATLLSPLNSELTKVGDRVFAKIKPFKQGKLNLPEGGVLEGTVESVQRAALAQTPARMVLKFSWLYANGERLDLTALPVGDGHIDPVQVERPPSKKQMVRAVLMTATRVAVPMAIGTGGISLAITAGAGAVIGGLLCDDRHYFKGAVRGAWEGAGLSMFDPIVCKGASVVLPQGTVLALNLRGQMRLPLPRSESTVKLQTSARILASAQKQEAVVASAHGAPFPQVDLTVHGPLALPASDGAQLATMDIGSVDDDEDAPELMADASAETGDISSAGDPETRLLLLTRQAKLALKVKDLPRALFCVEQALRLDSTDPDLCALHQKLIEYVTGNKPASL